MLSNLSNRSGSYFYSFYLSLCVNLCISLCFLWFLLLFWSLGVFSSYDPSTHAQIFTNGEPCEARPDRYGRSSRVIFACERNAQLHFLRVTEPVSHLPRVFLCFFSFFLASSLFLLLSECLCFSPLSLVGTLCRFLSVFVVILLEFFCHQSTSVWACRMFSVLFLFSLSFPFLSLPFLFPCLYSPCVPFHSFLRSLCSLLFAYTFLSNFVFTNLLSVVIYFCKFSFLPELTGVISLPMPHESVDNYQKEEDVKLEHWWIQIEETMDGEIFCSVQPNQRSPRLIINFRTWSIKLRTDDSKSQSVSVLDHTSRIILRSVSLIEFLLLLFAFLSLRSSLSGSPWRCFVILFSFVFCFPCLVYSLLLSLPFLSMRMSVCVSLSFIFLLSGILIVVLFLLLNSLLIRMLSPVLLLLMDP